jgi:hypothetical protein
VAHSWQNLAVGGLTKPQLVQPASNGEAHSMQNFAPAAFCVEQFGQITAGSLRNRDLSGGLSAA